MSRYRRKYLSKRISSSIYKDVFRNDRAYTISKSSQLNSDTLNQPILTDWAQKIGALSIYDFDVNDPYSDKQNNNNDIVPDTATSVSSFDGSGLLGEFSLDATTSKASATISGLTFGRTTDRSFIIVSKLPVPGNDYFGGPGERGDNQAFVQAAYSAVNGKAVLSMLQTDGSSIGTLEWLPPADSNKLAITMVRWKDSENEFSARWKIIGEDSFNQNSSSFPIAATNTSDTFYIGPIGAGGTTTENSKFYWIGFFDRYLSNEEFEYATSLIKL